MKIYKKKVEMQMLGIASVGLLAILTVALFCPVSEQVNAEGESDPGLAMTRNAVDVKPMIALSLDTLASTEVVPTSTGGTSMAMANLVVTTNSTSGFSVMMNGVNGTDLKASDKGNSAVIASTTKSATLTAMDVNTWGFYIGRDTPATNSEFSPVPGESTKIASTTINGGVTDYKLAFGMKVDPKIPAGVYSGSVVVSAVANPTTVTNLLQLTYMQEMTADICANTLDASDDIGFKMNPITKQLIDTRDGKSYWVAKLADGKCWMTQNLAFDIKVNDDGTSNVKAVDTDVTSDWNILPPVGWHGWRADWNDVAKAAFGTVANSKERTAIANAFGDSGWKFETSFSNDKMRQYDYFTYTYTENGESQTVTYYPPETTLNEMLIRNQNSAVTWLVRTSYNFGKYMSAILPTNEAYRCTNKTIEACESKGIINVEGWTPNFTMQNGSFQLSDGTTFEGTVLANQANHTYDAHYLFGNYYMWNVAMARSGALEDDSSICPKNWRMPSGDDTGDFVNLLTAYGVANSYGQYSVNTKLAPFYFPLAGFTWADTDSSEGIFYMNRTGRYYSSTRGSGSQVKALQVNANSDLTIISVGGDDVSVYPHTIRCVAR